MEKNGFLAPNGNFYPIEIEKMAELCQLICNIYCESNSLIQKQYRIFKQKYNLFLPEYDFVIHKLHFIHIGILGNSSMYGISKCNQLLIKPMPESISFDENGYELLKSNNGKELASASTYDDNNLGYSHQLKEYEEGILLQNGEICSLKNIPSHSQLICSFIIGLISTCPMVYNDIKYYGFSSKLSSYILQRLGIVILASKSPKYGFYDENLLSTAQKNIIQKLQFDSEMDSSMRNDFKSYFQPEDSKDFIKRLTEDYIKTMNLKQIKKI